MAGTVVTLDGSASTDPNFAPLNYAWTQVNNGAPTITLSNPAAQKPTFSAPPATSPTGYTAQFNLTVTNGGVNPGDDATTSTPVSITIAASTPTVVVSKAREGGGATFFVGDKVTLTAGITNPDGTNPADYTYVWSQVSGITTALSSTTAANPTYIIPANGSAVCASGTGATNCPRFQVVVTKINTGKSSAAAALANYGSTLPTRPTANAGTAQSVKVGGTVNLNGSGVQAQGHPLSYQWTQTAGPAVDALDAAAAQPTFTAPSSGRQPDLLARGDRHHRTRSRYRCERQDIGREHGHDHDHRLHAAGRERWFRPDGHRRRHRRDAGCVGVLAGRWPHAVATRGRRPPAPR